jgi:hypothetical protein
MARRKSPEDETQDQKDTRLLISSVTDAAPRALKVSWDRKMDNMVTLMASLTPLEDKILDLMAQKTPIINEIDALRKVMVKECIHPRPSLTSNDGIVHCKFCNRRFNPL